MERVVSSGGDSGTVSSELENQNGITIGSSDQGRISQSSSSSDRMPDILRLEMLSLLHTKPLTGYELRKSIKASFNHEISFGTLYPNLASLERLGLIQGKWVSLGENQLRRKRIFTLTDTGKGFLTDNLDKLHRLAESMQKMNVVVPVAAPQPAS